MREHQQPQQPAAGAVLFHSVTRDIVTVRSACRQPFGARVAAYRIESDGKSARLIFAHDRRVPRRVTL